LPKIYEVEKVSLSKLRNKETTSSSSSSSCVFNAVDRTVCYASTDQIIFALVVPEFVANSLVSYCHLLVVGSPPVLSVN
jgi:hypothetical protein